uniref:TIL domain-containing protein n=1 Tax=Phlebotomus papatasi TaxID=29031 RepID=A0A1B0CYV0_PHLPP
MSVRKYNLSSDLQPGMLLQGRIQMKSTQPVEVRAKNSAEYTYCGSGCTDPCESRGKDCRDACQEGCFCKDNFSRITSDTPCVPDSQCPSLRTSLSTVTCGKNEVYTSCGRSCQTTCSNLGTSCQIVNVKCSDGCYCQDGYARIYEGGCCVKQELCPKTPCGNNEIWLECGEPKQRIPCPQNCQDVGKPCKTEYPICTADSTGGCYCKPGYSRPPGTPTCDRECSSLGKSCDVVGSGCNPGCFCRTGYARHPETGKCVPTSQCPAPKPECSRNEEYRSCDYRCKENCNSDYCKYEKRPCEEGCFCKSGYARVNDKCIPKSFCKSCPTHERYLECGNSCQESCKKDISRCRTCERSGCFCEEGYSRINGVCRPDSECPERQCPSHEVFLECGSACQDNCDQNQPCTDQCVQGCFCEPGYARINGKCVLRSSCNVCPPHEEYLECENEHFEQCGNTCTESCLKERVNCSPNCYPGCYCNKGFVRMNGKCVPEKFCKKCNLNEEYLTCGNACQDLCDASAATCPAECVEGCFCEKGFSRINGVCVPRRQCFTCGTGEEYTECGSSCLELCNRNVILCPPVCEEGCFCASGFSRVNGQCLPNELCPTCEENEEYQSCGNYCLERCGNPLCPADLPCDSGCFCKPGFKRDGKVCVPEEQCPPQCQGPNEVYSTCGNNCTDLCPDPNRFCTLECYNGCFCAEGFSRPDYNSPCIPTEQCTTCSGENEQFYECGNPCLENCPIPEICTLQCVKGCFCKPNHCTRPFEELSSCGNNCTELCPRPGRACNKNCWRGCFCKKGYYRAHYDGLCIPESKCPAPPVCTGPNEEVRDCSSPCDDDCPGENNECAFDCQVVYSSLTPSHLGGHSSVGTQTPSFREKPGWQKHPTSQTIPAICQTGCFCKPGHSRIQGVCTPTRDCPACGENEEYTYCGSGCTDPCETRGQNCLDACREGCFCKEDYSRVTPGSPCVPDSQCTNVTCGRYEVYASCGRNCQTTCDNLGVNCPIVHIRCPDGCYCEPGYARVYEGGSCVKQDYCPYSPCGDNEVWLECGDPKQPIPCPQNCKDVGKPCQEEYPSCDISDQDFPTLIHLILLHLKSLH